MSASNDNVGLIHIYCGNGKGKTTAAMGLALRAVGSGKKVLIVQFLKNGTSSELIPLSKMDNVTMIFGKASNSFSFSMTEEEKIKTLEKHNENLQKAISSCNNNNNGYNMLILDEVIGAVNSKLIDYDLLINFIKNKPSQIELILTGRNPNDQLIEYADYVSKIEKIKHPYNQGIMAREGIEY